MPHGRRSTTVGGVFASALLCVSASPSADAHPAGAMAAASPAAKAISYHGVSVRVPADWPVVDLEAAPGTCVRLDRTAVYLGAASPQQDCPAHAVGRGDTVWLGPTTAADRSEAARPGARTVRRGGLDLRVRRDEVGHEQQAMVGGRAVTLRTAWAADPTAVDRAAASLTTDPASAPATTDRTPVAPAADATTGTSATSLATAAVPSSTGTVLTGMSFDTCAAPSTSTMSAWKAASPYAAVGIYIGGSQRACGDGNLSASWVSTVTRQGWGLIPTYVGLQAPCYVGSAGRFTASNAASTGASAAADAVARAKAFGIPAGSALVYDIENYLVPDASCSGAVLDLVTAWTRGLHSAGYLSAVYGNVGSLMADMSTAVRTGDTTFTPPDHIWYARWDGLQTTTNGSRFPGFPDAYWSGHTRHHQYRGDFSETWGGVSMLIDADWSNAPVPGRPTQVGYGTNTIGPGARGFVFTGDMQYWRPMPGVGAKGRAYWTGASSNGTESNGATWSPTLPNGLYAVDVNIPATSPSRSTGVGRYTLRDWGGTKVVNLDQRSATGYRTIGAVLMRAGVAPVVHLGDNASTTGTILADAVRFRQIASPPPAPTAVEAAAGPARATVAWSTAVPNGSTVTGYLVTATPGGATMRLAATARSATFTGLTNGTAYTFTVRATSWLGTGPSSKPSAAVTPRPGGRVTAVSAVRLLDTRVGTMSNPRRSALGPGESIVIRVAGVTGSPVPAGAMAAKFNLTVTGGTKRGYVTIAGATPSSLNYLPGQSVANVAFARLAADGSMRFTNVSSGTVQLIVDIQGQVTSGTAGSLWNPIRPTRLLDTRTGSATNPRRTALAPGESLAVHVAGVAGSPVPAGATGVAFNLTATLPTAAGYLAVSGASSSAVNFTAGRTVGNLTMARLASDGTVTLRNVSNGTVHLLVDIQGYAAGSGRTASPARTIRLMDTRTGTTANPRVGALQPGASLTVSVTGVRSTNVPAGASAAVVNLTVVSPTASGQLSVSDGAGSSGSLGNFTPSVTVATLAVVKLSPTGTFVVTNQSRGTLQLLVDSQGFAGP